MGKGSHIYIMRCALGGHDRVAPGKSPHPWPVWLGYHALDCVMKAIVGVSIHPVNDIILHRSSFQVVWWSTVGCFLLSTREGWIVSAKSGLWSLDNWEWTNSMQGQKDGVCTCKYFNMPLIISITSRIQWSSYFHLQRVWMWMPLSFWHFWLSRCIISALPLFYSKISHLSRLNPP